MNKHIKLLCYFLSICLTWSNATAQFNLKGKVIDSTTGESLPSATVRINNTFKYAISDQKGNFVLKNLKQGALKINISYIGYKEFSDSINLQKNDSIIIKLDKQPWLTDEVIVEATRVQKNGIYASSLLDRAAIEKKDQGQDVPYFLNNMPSVTVTSDAGTGIGYTGIRIRGTDPTRINVTINGIPVNDAESQGTFWVDLPDVISSTEDIQVQRGVGTSTNGAGAFGGSINLKTLNVNPEAYAEIRSGVGSFETYRNTVKFGTGLLKNRWAVDGRFSNISSDGYVDRGASNLQSYYFSTGYHGTSNTVKFITFSGREKTYQSWYGTPQDSLKTNRTFNPAGIIYGVNGEISYYDDQTDNYQQDYYQLHFINNRFKNLTIQSSLHYTIGKGYYEEYRQQDDLANYGLSTVAVTDTILNADLVRRRWLDNDFYGGLYNLTYNHKKFQLVVGQSLNQYYGRHFGEVIWSQFAFGVMPEHEYYRDNALKNDFNSFAKVSFKPLKNFNVFADLQYRMANYHFTGIDTAFMSLPQSVNHAFINPKAGVSYSITDHKNLYASFAKASKEPSRDDYVQSTNVSRPEPEILYDYEFGYRQESNWLNFSLNGFYMDYINQLVLTGEINDVGAYTRTNIPQSYRTGLESEINMSFLKRKLNVGLNVTYSQNKIQSFNEYIDNYDTFEQEVNSYTNSSLSFSPEWIASGVIEYNFFKGASVSVFTKYVSEQFLDNTSNQSRKIDAYTSTDLTLSYRIGFKNLKEVYIHFNINNIFDELYETNGYTFSYIYGGEKTTENYYYPQAGRNFTGGIILKF